MSVWGTILIPTTIMTLCLAYAVCGLADVSFYELCGGIMIKKV